MAEENEAVDPVEAYVRQYSASHTRESIRDRLLAAGYEPERIDAALTGVARQQLTPAGSKIYNTVAITCGVLVVLAVLVFGVCVFSLSRHQGGF